MLFSMTWIRVWALIFSAASLPAAVYRDRITPHWFEPAKFWYRNALPGGAEEFVVVDAEAGTRKRVEKGDLPGANEKPGGLRAEAEPRPSSNGSIETSVTFNNTRSNPVELFWI